MDQVQIEVLTISLTYVVLSNNIPITENLCNLEELWSTKSFTLIVSPLKIAGAAGSPVPCNCSHMIPLVFQFVSKARNYLISSIGIVELLT